MTRVENILMDNGFIRIFGPKSGGYSSIVPSGVASLYRKGDTKAVVGLHEPGYPPTLIWPRKHRLEKVGVDKHSHTYRIATRDSEIIGMLEKMTDDEILQYIKDNQ